MSNEVLRAPLLNAGDYCDPDLFASTEATRREAATSPPRLCRRGKQENRRQPFMKGSPLDVNISKHLNDASYSYFGDGFAMGRCTDQ